MVRSWRLSRLGRFASSFDASRYHAQVLFVDDDGSRARTCEALLERVAMWADAGWWIYPHAVSTKNNVADGDAPPPSLLASASAFGLCRGRLAARAATLEADDLSAYDVVVCVDYTVLEQVRALARDQVEAAEARVLCLTDFLAFEGADRMEALDEELRDLVARHYTAAAALTELPSVAPSDAAQWEQFLACAVLGCAALTSCLKERIDLWFVDAFLELLEATYPTSALLEGVHWAEAEEVLRRHQVTGGLDPRERKRLFGEHCERLRQRGARRGD